MKRILGVFRNRWFTSIIGLLAVGILIWFVGPLIAIAGAIPLKSVVARLVVILVCVVLWGLNNLRIQMQVNRANTELASGFADAQAAAPETSQSAEEVAALKERFDEALGVLRSTTRKKGGAGIYDLPWYIIIGPPGSGKTTALLNSGLKFPLADRFGKEALRGVGGTRNCDWWFTEDAVLLDTAGRYTTQDSHMEADSAAWEGFLGLLKKHRRRRPINGALVAISLADLLTQSEAERAQQVRAIKQRLQELDKHLGIRFPIYVLLTKCDLIAGFMEFFDDFGVGERGQVWGVSFPYDKGQTSGSPVTSFMGEFDALIDRLNKRLLWRMQQERDPVRRARMFSFPQQMASLRELLNNFLTEVFSASRYEDSLLLRGAYFTSGTQEGSPIDRVMGSLSRTFGLSPQMISPFGGQGRSYFVTRLLKEVIFEEADLVGANRRLEVQRRWLQRVAYGGAVGFTAIAILAWMTSFTRNEVYIYRFKSALEDFEQTRALQAGGISNFDQLLQRLNSIRDVTRVYSPFEEGVPFLMGMGLYQGNKLTAAANDLYRQELDTLLLPSIKYRLEQHLSAGKGGPDFQYEALKTYLMIGDEAHRDPELIKLWMDLDWQGMYPDDAETQGHFQHHLTSMLDLGYSSDQLNQDIIASARLGLKSVPLSELLFGRMKRDYIADDDNPFRVIDAIGPSGRNVFQRSSGVPLEQGVTSLYTYEGYHEYFKAQVKQTAALSSEENWILETKKTELSDAEIKQLQKELQELYFADYIRSWDRLLGDISIVPFQNLRQATDVLNTLAAPNSPLRSLLLATAKHTALVSGGLLDKAASKAASGGTQGRLSRLLQSAGGGEAVASKLNRPGQVVDEHYAPLNALLTPSETGSAPIDQVVSMLSQLFGQFDAMAMGVGVDALSMAKGSSSADMLTRIQVDASRRPEPLRSWLQQVSRNSRQVTLSSARAQINEQWQSDILPLCNRALNGRYPFFKDSPREIALIDFGRLFGPGGLFDAFFKDNLKPFVKVSGGSWQWKSVGDSTIGMSNNVLAQFKRAALIRDVYFQSGGQTPSVDFSLKPVYLDGNVRSFSLDLEGQQFRYRHGPARVMRAQWPGPDSTGQVRLEFEDDSGARLANTIEGPWAWFRLLERSELVAKSSDLVLASFTERGRRTTWELRAATVTNPFLAETISQFRCPTSL